MKKIVFVALILFGSLLLLQYMLLNGVMTPPVSQQNDVPQLVVQPVKDQIFDTGDHIVVLKDGKYYVYEKKLPST
ncbi:MAG: hypothetical protein H6608_07820 [Flavobacteriales bacterium]|nr:hypothetical protein [Flavobacteriales bacterium]